MKQIKAMNAKEITSFSSDKDNSGPQEPLSQDTGAVINRLEHQLLMIYEAYVKEKQRADRLAARVEELERPDDGYRNDWTWTRKILFAIEKTGRPMRSAEIIDFLAPREPHLREHTSQRQFFSALINAAARNGRVGKEKKKGERGFYYYRM